MTRCVSEGRSGVWSTDMIFVPLNSESPDILFFFFPIDYPCEGQTAEGDSTWRHWWKPTSWNLWRQTTSASHPWRCPTNNIIMPLEALLPISASYSFLSLQLIFLWEDWWLLWNSGYNYFVTWFNTWLRGLPSFSHEIIPESKICFPAAFNLYRKDM